MSNFFTKTADFLGFDGQFGYQGGTAYSPMTSAPPRKPTLPIEDFGQTRTGSLPLPSPKPSSSGGSFSWGSVGDFVQKIGNTVSTGVETFFLAKSRLREAELAEEIDKARIRAIQNSVQTAPAPAQVLLPSFSDFLNDPREAASRVTPAAIAGSGVLQGGMSIATYALGGLAIYMLAKG